MVALKLQTTSANESRNASSFSNSCRVSTDWTKCLTKTTEIKKSNIKKGQVWKQAGAELCQAQEKL